MASSAYSYILSIFKNTHYHSLDSLEVEEVRLILYTLEKSELLMLKTELENNGWQYLSTKDREYFIGCIERKISPPKWQPQRNETIAELLKLFTNKKSGKVLVARRKLKQRYEHQSIGVQRKIINAFLDGAKSDRYWAYNQLMKNWSRRFEGKVDAMWNAYHEERCRCIIVRYFSKEYLMQHKDVWRSSATCAGDEYEVDRSSGLEYEIQLKEAGNNYSRYADFKAYKRICMRLANTPGFVIEKNYLFEGDYYEVMAMTGGTVDGAEMLDYIFRLVAKYADDSNSLYLARMSGLMNCECEDKYYSVSSVCVLYNLLYFMALLKLDNELRYFFKWNRCVCERFWRRVNGLDLTIEQDKDVYAKVLKMLLPKSKDELLYNLHTYEVEKDALSDDKASRLEMLCNKNPKLATMIEKLNLE